ncbi:MAG: arylesterase [Burkholderiales bacterium]|jgi:acyl-CoA thioesterase-1|nr:arylesterase [Burkholderiales bacterium]
MFNKCVLFLLCWMALCAQAQPVVLVYGDSLSAGYGLPQDKGWVALLADRLRAEKFDYRVVNASVSGETTLGGANRLDAVLAQHRPAIVVIELGGNDGLRGLSLAATRQNLETMLRTVNGAGARPLLIGMQLPPNYGTAYTGKFQTLFEEVARERKTPLVPFMLAGFGEKREYFQADGIHPTAEAQPLMLENIWPLLRPMLAKSR